MPPRDAAEAAPTPAVPTTPDPFDLILLEAAHYDLFQGKVAHANLRMIVNAARDSAARSTPAEALDGLRAALERAGIVDPYQWSLNEATERLRAALSTPATRSQEL